MKRLPLLITCLLAVAMSFAGLAPASALDPRSVLDGHDPTTNQTLQLEEASKPAPAVASPAAATPVNEDFYKKMVTRLTSILDRLLKIFEKLVKIVSGSSGKKSGSKDPGKDSGKNDGKEPGKTPGKDVGSGAEESKALAAWKGGKLSPEKFARLLGPAARESMKKTGVPASVTLAQAALETGWGGSTIGDAKNLFGIKGKGPAGSITVKTKEFVNGRYITINAAFRKYHTWQESIDDHAKLITGNSRYKNCMKNKNNPDQFARELQKAGYATSPTYASTLISIMKKYNFYQYDK